MEEKIRKVLFWDFDGTLALPTSSADYLHIALNNHGYTIPFDEVTQHAKAGFTWNMPEKSYTEHTGEKWWNQVFNHFELLYRKYELPEKDVISINNLFKQHVLDADSYTLYQDTVSVLGLCAKLGYENYILSNNFPKFPLVIKDLGLSEYFKDYIISTDIGYEKPRIEIFKYALNIAQQPQICYMIGDNPIADIQGGKNAGMSTILVHIKGNYDADYVFDNLAEIPAQLV